MPLTINAPHSDILELGEFSFFFNFDLGISSFLMFFYFFIFWSGNSISYLLMFLKKIPNDSFLSSSSHCIACFVPFTFWGVLPVSLMGNLWLLIFKAWDEVRVWLSGPKERWRMVQLPSLCVVPSYHS